MNVKEALILLEEEIFTKLYKSGKPYPVHQNLVEYLSFIPNLDFDKTIIYGVNVMGSSHEDSLVIAHNGLSIGIVHNWDANPDGMNRFMHLNPLAYKSELLRYGDTSKEESNIIILILELILIIQRHNYY